MKKVVVLVWVLQVIVSHTLIFAQSDLDLRFQAGAARMKVNFNDEPGDARSAMTLTGALGYNMNPHLHVGIGVGYLKPKLDADSMSARFIPVTVYAKIYLLTGRVKPYFYAGLSRDYLKMKGKIENRQFEIKSNFYEYDLGTGCMIAVTKYLGLDFGFGFKKSISHNVKINLTSTEDGMIVKKVISTPYNLILLQAQIGFVVRI